MHLQQVHTPWNPGKAELARRERIRRRVQGLVYRLFQGRPGGGGKGVFLQVKDDILPDDVPVPDKEEDRDEYKQRVLKHVLGDVWNRDGKQLAVKYHASPEEIQEWSEKVVQIARQLEEDYQMSNSKKLKDEENNNKDFSNFVQAGLDRDGNKSNNYKDSLPPFIKAASEGRLDVLKQMVKDADSVHELLETKDRNSSLAEDWAAGNGHLDCLKFLMELTESSAEGGGSSSPEEQHHTNSKIRIGNNEPTSSRNERAKKRRKREGKTSLHYACRNGHLDVVKYLLEGRCQHNKSMHSSRTVPHYRNADVTSGDGTTPLHLACYGGHLGVIRYLIEEKNADLYKTNDWECGVGHWIAMSIQPNQEELEKIFNYVKGLIGEKSFEVFGRTQKQGHSSVHKAAQKLNRKVIEWLAQESKTCHHWTAEQRAAAGAEDAGGNKPSTIWRRMKGSESFSIWMKEECGW